MKACLLPVTLALLMPFHAAAKDGDVLAYAFTQARGQMEGQYVRKGGTGKFADSRETGWFRPLRLEGEITKGQWGGKSACN